MGKSITVAEYLTQQLALCGKSQGEIAEEIQYGNPNVLTMFKQGKTKVPVRKVKALAKAIGVDSVFLLKLVMNEYMPEAWEVVQDIVGGSANTEYEDEILKIIREGTGGMNVKPETDEEVLTLKALAEGWANKVSASYVSAINAKTLS